MKCIRLSLLATTVSTLLLSNAASAAAFQLYELGTPIIGTAGVGQAAVASDASTTYFNPAGMTQLPTTEYMVGGQMIVPFANFSKRASQTTLRGDNGGDAGSLMPGLGLFYVYNYSPKLKLGFSMTSPYGGVLDYTNGWVGRYHVQSLMFYTINLNPSVAYQINNWASIGAGLSLEYANVHETVAIPVPETQLIDGQANIKVSNLAPGVNVGFMIKPTPMTKIGVAYRSQISHDLHGDLTFLRLSVTPNTSTRMTMPQNVIVSVAQDLSHHFSLLGELGWSNWSSMRNSVVNVANLSGSIPRNWSNTYRVGLGGQYQYNNALMLQAGASLDSSPTSSSRRLPDLPMDRQIRVGAGITYAIIKAVNLGFSYEYINFGNANINNLSSVGNLSGSYSRNYANVLQMSINVAC
ncbi:MAG: outer membrane protein transport protein [Gammaproteobacteria bacterium]|nr:outer membrane protein transport protein [Gammaproteobacteria bacterium]